MEQWKSIKRELARNEVLECNPECPSMVTHVFSSLTAPVLLLLLEQFQFMHDSSLLLCLALPYPSEGLPLVRILTPSSQAVLSSSSSILIDDYFHTDRSHISSHLWFLSLCSDIASSNPFYPTLHYFLLFLVSCFQLITLYKALSCSNVILVLHPS